MKENLIFTLNNLEHFELFVALYEERLDDDEKEMAISLMAKKPELRKLYSEFIISNRDDYTYDRRLLEIKIGLVMDYDIYSDPSHRQTVHQLTKKIIAQLEEPNLSIADDLIDPLIDMTVDDQYSSMETYDYAMGAGGLDSFIYLIVPVVVQMISILEYNRSFNYKEVVPMLIDHAIQRSNFPKKLSWLRTPVLTYKLKKLSKHIQDAVEQLLNKTNETST